MNSNPTTEIAEGSPPSVRPRVLYVDNARAIGIVLVVAGHAPAFAGWMNDFIFAFHMPLFFLLSGLMVDESRLNQTIIVRTRQLARSVLVPYLFYFIVSFLYWLLVKRHGLRAQEFGALPWWDPFLSFVYGTGDRFYFNVVLWFFPCLFVTAFAHHVLRKIMPALSTSIFFVCAAFAFVVLHNANDARWPWSADCGVAAAAFYSAGSTLHSATPLFRGRAWSGILLLISAVSFVVCFLLAAITGHVDLNNLVFGNVPSLYLPMGTFGIIGTLAVSLALPPSTLLRWLSENTLVIFPLHFLLFSVITGVLTHALGAESPFKTWTPWMGLAYTAAALMLCYPCGRFLRVGFPWVFNRPRTSSTDTRADLRLRRIGTR